MSRGNGVVLALVTLLVPDYSAITAPRTFNLCIVLDSKISKIIHLPQKQKFSNMLDIRTHIHDIHSGQFHLLVTEILQHKMLFLLTNIG